MADQISVEIASGYAYAYSQSTGALFVQNQSFKNSNRVNLKRNFYCLTLFKLSISNVWGVFSVYGQMVRD